MQKALLRSSLVIVTICWAIVSCTHEPLDPRNVTVNRTLSECASDTVYFERDIQPLLTTYCVSGCHDEQNAADGVVLSSYSRIMATADVRAGEPDESDLFERITESDLGKRMPPPPAAALTAEQIASVRKWIEQGAQNNTCNFDTGGGNTDCVPEAVSYANDVVPIFQSNGCIGCHSGGNVVLSDHGGTKASAESGQLIKALKHLPGAQAMPQGAAAPIDSCSIATIEAWINASYPNN